jgi:branched-chain amino acid transport system permease protein
MSTDSQAPRVAPPWRAPLIVFALGLVAWWLLPEQLGLLTRIAITALFVLSLDLVVGIAGLRWVMRRCSASAPMRQASLPCA